MGSCDQRYAFDEVVECIAIEQYLGPVPIDLLSNHRTALGTIMIRGFYCNDLPIGCSPPSLSRFTFRAEPPLSLAGVDFSSFIVRT